ILGLHVFRMVLAYGVYHFKRSLMFFLVPANDRKEFAKNGYILKENFLENEVFEELLSEINNYQGQARDIIEGETLTRRLYMTHKKAEELPAYKHIFQNKYLSRLLRYTSASNQFPRSFIECIFHKATKKQGDPQKVLHKDTFHPTMKAWIFMADVEEENAPFIYVPGSHKLSWKRIKWEYKMSILKSSKSSIRGNEYTQGGAFRALERDIEYLGLPPAKHFTVKKNTLIIADTMGFHCRGQGAAGFSRLTLWFSSRINPFNPFPGLNLSITRKIRDNLFTKYLEYKGNKELEDISTSANRGFTRI
ncbi:MAG: hypothetical protein COV36_07750, partial [Alphaproteobacteria bacterium CG11_big_fil_rev_8_21_14_0_20_44_7]